MTATFLSIISLRTTEDEPYSHQYAAGGDMDRLSGSNQPQHNPNRVILLLLLAILLFSCLSHRSTVDENSFSFVNVSENYNPQTGELSISGDIKSKRIFTYDVSLKFHVYLNDNLIYKKNLNIKYLSLLNTQEFSFSCNIHEIVNDLGIEPYGDFRYSLSVRGWTFM